MGRKKFVLPPGQTVLTFQPLQGPPPATIIPPPTLDPTTCYTANVITSRWSPNSATINLGPTIPSTRDWTLREMQFFKFSYFQVKYFEAQEYICPTKDLTAAAQEILLSQMSLGGFVSGLCLPYGFLVSP
jgi:hypothetical protein